MVGASLSMLGFLRGSPPSRPQFMDAGTVTLRAVDGALKELSELPTELALKRAASFLANLVEDPIFLEAEVRPLLENVRGEGGDWYVAHSYEGEDPSYSLQVFVWPPGTKTKIHDHSSSGSLLLCCGVRTRGALRASG